MFAYDVIPHGITGDQPYELMFGCKSHAFCDSWLWLASYNDKSQPAGMLGWMSNMRCWWVPIGKHWSTLEKDPKSQTRASGKTHHILIGNLVLLRDHPECQNKFQNNYKSKLFYIVAHHKDPNAYVMPSISRRVNRWQLFNLKSCKRIPLW